MWKLVIEDDEGKRTVVPLTREDYSIGRKEGNTIRLTERNVSREHARLKRNGAGSNGGGADHGMYVLEDLTSYNGVYVNGLRVAHSQELTHGDLIQIGDYRIILQDDAVSDAPATAVPASDPRSTQPGARQSAQQLMERPNRLVMLVGPTPGAEYPLDQERLTVGRAEDATISVNHNSVSRLHCEIHALGDGRYEIVDKGSSNGVRVNYSDLRRGIIEAGDIIELGDVKFKFVAAGQIFRPGATESQVLTAIGERAASAVVSPRARQGSALPYVIFGLVVAAGAAGAWLITHPPRGDAGTTPSTAAPAESSEQKVLDEATRLCKVDDCDAAHKLVNELVSQSSPARQSQAFRNVENTWADSMIQRAEKEPDIAKKRQLLHEVEASTTVDETRRKTANDSLAQLDSLTSPNPSQLPTASLRDAGAVVVDSNAIVIPPPGPTARKPLVADPGSTAVSTTAPQPTTKPTSTAADSNATDRDRNLMLNGNMDQARRDLESRLYSGRGTPDDARALKSICKKQGDRSCEAAANKYITPQQ
jgi:pSer/pThr/pTyr-binding forkhead associated (FHA) protein